MEPQETVLSEVHMETCPPGHTTWSTRFMFTLPAAADTSSEEEEKGGDQEDSCLDSDGDLVPTRRQHSRSQHSVHVRHSLATPLSRCGEQVWLGACLLGDWALAHRQQLAGQVAVELGAGVGLVSLLLGTTADNAVVFLTDADCGALQLAQHNVDDAVTAAAAAAGQQRPDIHVRWLDWLALFDTQLQALPQADVLELLNTGTAASSPVQGSSSMCRHQTEPQQDPDHKQSQQQQQQQQDRQQGRASPPPVAATAAFCWSAADLQLLSRASLWLAADVVYDQTLTDAFMHTAAALMRWQQQQQHTPHLAAAPVVAPAARLLVAVEKRYCFTLHDMDAAAPAFDHFMSYLQPTETSLALMPAHDQQRLRHHHHQQQQQQQGKALFRGERLDVQSIPQALQYDRSEYLELWELTLLPLDRGSSFD